MPAPFDAVLIVSFGGPQGPDDIRPFLANVLRGRRVPPERVEEVAHHYELFGGVSPITDITARQADGLASRLRPPGTPLPVYVGMRNWHPFLADTLREMRAAGVRRAIGFIAAAQHSYSSCEQYRENVADARAELRSRAAPTSTSPTSAAGSITRCSSRPMPRTCATRCSGCPSALRAVGARSSAPRTAFRCRWPSGRGIASSWQESARLVAREAGMRDWALVYQSRSGRPQDPWLEPDVCDYLRSERDEGLRGGGALPDRVRLRSHRGAVRPRYAKPRGRAARSGCRWRAPRRSTTIRCFST